MCVCCHRLVCCHVKKESLGGLLSYFLVISKMSRDTEHLGLGWLQYNQLFRKKAAGNASVSWGEYDIPCCVAHVLNKNHVGGFWVFSKSSFDTRICFQWNKYGCEVRHCRFRHACMHCQGDHQAKFCKMPKNMGRNFGGESSHKRHRSPSSMPSKRKSHK